MMSASVSSSLQQGAPTFTGVIGSSTMTKLTAERLDEILSDPGTIDRDEILTLAKRYKRKLWIKWDGEEARPVDTGDRVDIRLRNGDKLYNMIVDEDDYTGEMYWSNDETTVDIVAYRVRR